MNDLVYLFPAAICLAVAVTVAAVPRFGRTSWLLSLYLALPALGFLLHSAIGDERLSPEWKARTAFVMLFPALPAAIAFLWSINRPEIPKPLQGRAMRAAALFVPAPLLAAWILLRPPGIEHAAELTARFIALGPGGYVGSIYLLVLAVMGLANIEQVLRGADERVRSQIKFLLLGLSCSLASILYVASKVLLYSFRYALLPVHSFLVFPVISLCASALIFLSWRRCAGRGIISVSQSLVYSSITLLGVGIYLIVSSLVARWASQLGDSAVEVEAIVFLLAVLALGCMLLWTGFRHRMRRWLRHNIFSGRYDYRQSWVIASEKIRSVDPPATAALALAEVAQKSLGAIDVSVWMRERNPNRLHLLAFLGAEPVTPEADAHGVVELLVQDSAIVSENEVGPAKESVRTFMRRTHAALLVPLVSSDRLVGVLAVGADRSGQHYRRDARDFLRVLGGHAAGEIHKSELLTTLVATKEAEAFRSFSTFLLHDLKNFASTLSLIAKNAVRHQENPEFQKDAFVSVHDTAEKMKRLCNSLKTFSGNLAANRRRENLSEIARASAQAALNGCEQAVRLELAPVVDVFVDPEEIARVLQNLLLNSREATPAHGEIVVRTSSASGKAELLVIDNGRGIAAEFLQNDLFHAFRTTKSDGLGIGLFQCRKIVEAHNGAISIESRPGCGTTVRVELPCASAAAPATASS